MENKAAVQTAEMTVGLDTERPASYWICGLSPTLLEKHLLEASRESEKLFVSPPQPPQKRWQNEKFGVDPRDDYEDENLYEVSRGLEMGRGAGTL